MRIRAPIKFNVGDNRVAAVDLRFENALSATPSSSLGYPPFWIASGTTGIA